MYKSMTSMCVVPNAQDGEFSPALRSISMRKCAHELGPVDRTASTS